MESPCGFKGNGGSIKLNQHSYKKNLYIGVKYISASGIYHFEVYMMVNVGGREGYFEIMKNGVRLCVGYAAGSYVAMSSCNTNVDLLSGDQVYVQATGPYNGGFCGFSGFMVKAL